MVKKGDEKLRFLMRHLPGMKEVPVPKPGGKPHTSYIFKHTKFSRGHSFLVQGQVADPGLWVVYRGSVEFRRAEVISQERVERLEERLPQLRRPRKSASQPRLHGIGRDGNVAAEANDCNPSGVMSRRGLLVPGGVFGSLPFPAPEPFTVRVATASCEVFYIAAVDFPKMPRKLLDVVQDYVALSTTWRLSCHQKSTAFRKSNQKPQEVEERPREEEPVQQELVNSDVSELIEECRKERMCR